MAYAQQKTSAIYEFRKRFPKDIAGKAAPSQHKVHMSKLTKPDTGSIKRERIVAGNKRLTSAMEFRSQTHHVVFRCIRKGERNFVGVKTPCLKLADHLIHRRFNGNAAVHLQSPPLSQIFNIIH
jgi:hypothetical protein